MKRLFVYVCAGAGFITPLAYADEYNPFYPQAGINSATTVPNVYSDGSTGTLAQIGQMADSSVQQTDANQPNGYAKLDESGNITLPLIGDSSNSSAKASDSIISNKLTDTLPLLSNLRTYTYGNGSNTDASFLDVFVYNHCNQAVNIPAGYILPTNADGGAHFPDTSVCGVKHYTWIYNGKIHTTGGTPTNLRTVDDMHVNLEGGAIGLTKTKKNTTSSDSQMVYMQYVNNSKGASSASSSDSTKLSMPAIEMNVQAAPGSEGSMMGLNVDLTDNSTTGDNANVGVSSNVYKHSSVNKDWGISVAGYDFSASQPKNTISYTGIENDVQVNGQDVGASLWDPTQGGRHLMWLAANTVSKPNWKPLHKYNVGDMIVDANKSWIWVVVAAGTSSSGKNPTWAWQPSAGIYRDGSATFKAQIDYHGVVSKAIYVINDHVDDNFSYFDDVIGVDANVRDSSINLTKEILTNSKAASIRLAKNHPIDFSGDATQNGKNKTILQAQDNVTIGYETYPATKYGTSLTYTLNNYPTLALFGNDRSIRGLGNASFAIGDNGSLSGVKQAARAGITFGHSKYATRQTDVIYGSNGLEFTATDTSGRIKDNPTLELPATSYADGGTHSINVGSPMRLLNMTKSEILTLKPAEGTLVNNNTDHVPVIFENGKWYPLTLGTALSNDKHSPRQKNGR